MTRIRANHSVAIGLSMFLAVQPSPVCAQTPAPSLTGAASSPAGGEALDLAARARQLAASNQIEQAISLGERALVMARSRYAPRHEYVAYILDDLATWNARQRRFAEALQLSRQAVETIRSAKGAESRDYAWLVNNLASIYAASGQFEQAVIYYEKSATIFTRNAATDPEHAAQVARNLGVAYLELARPDDAETQFAAALRATRGLRGDQSPATARAYLDLAGVHLRQESIVAARNEASVARRIFSAQQPVDAASLASADVTLAQIDIYDSRLDSAKALLDQALKTLDASASADPLARASVLYNIGWIEILRREAIEAEHVYTEVLAIYRRAYADSHPAVARALHCLAIVYQDLGQFDEARRLYERAIAAFTASLGDASAAAAATRVEYSLLLSESGDAGRAALQARTALSTYERLPGRWDVRRGYAYSALARAEHRAGDLANAEKHYAMALALIGTVRGSESSDLPPGLTDLARIHVAQKRYSEAGDELARAVGILRKDGATTAAGLAESLSELANLRLAEGNPTDALSISREAVQIARQRLDVAQRALSSSALGEQRLARGLFEQFLEIGWANHPAPDTALMREMFEVAQLPHLSGTAGAVSQMAARFAAGQGRLAELVRQRQDAGERWQALDRSMIEELAGMPGVASGQARAPGNRQALAELTRSIETLDETLRRDFPRYAELTHPRPVAASAVQALLRPREALLLQVTSPEASYVFLVTSRSLDFTRANLNATQLRRTVDSIRAGLKLEGVRFMEDLPVFDVASANLLYRQLLAPFGQQLGRTQYLVAVVDRAMQSVPLSVLLATPASEPPKIFSDYSKLDFLSRHLSYSIDPSVSAFTALRAVTLQSGASRPFIGFGDPVLTGDGKPRRAALPNAFAGGVDPELLRTQLKPLHETRDELTSVAHALKASDRDLFFGADASKPRVMGADLASYRIVQFATHALSAGSFGLAEPALVLTPPKKATAADNGLLAASDIATLRLDADWVVLSACNTAAPEGRDGAEGLSGLAKAFFYAGGRALLVSHWTVESRSTAVLMVGTMRALADHPEIGRAEALRRAMLSMLDGESKPAFAHPVFWGAFVNVGEGAQTASP
ncbi:CHAT domain-containing tetratricopeptide repeat protein [Caballeronia humi]|uniref:CHAT domain protein n=1 Tax=Caballeronia humi TaxID=326474 RepID=A0A158G981_9BURK|nr:tetratricopeptide repeat protein [Caballeronia humi]SAL28189.1 CHAT domain protein [Caballeronia humi]